MKRSPLLPGSSPMKRTSFLRIASREAKTVAKIQSKGMKGRTPTAEEKRFMDAIANLGCLACLKDGRENLHGSIHHISGRTAPGAHFLTFLLCAGHHQAGTGEDKTLIAVHPDKARFEARYGSQMALLAEAMQKMAAV